MEDQIDQGNDAKQDSANLPCDHATVAWFAYVICDVYAWRHASFGNFAQRRQLSRLSIRFHTLLDTPRTSAARQHASTARRNNSVTRQRSSTARRNNLATRQRSSTARRNNSATRQDASATRQDASATRQRSSTARRLTSATRCDALHPPQKTDLKIIS